MEIFQLKNTFDMGLKGKLPAFICIVFSQKENSLLRVKSTLSDILKQEIEIHREASSLLHCLILR